MNYNKNDKYELKFYFQNDDPFYMTYHKNTIDEELLMFLIDIDIDFNNITSFKVDKLK
jgi:cell fate regulator YaaT (PSP1 superfamily)